MSLPGLASQLVAPSADAAQAAALKLARSSLEALALKAGAVLDARVLGTTPNGLTQLQIAGQTLSVQLTLPMPAGTMLRLEVRPSGANGQPLLVALPQAAPAQTAAPQPLPANAPALPLPQVLVMPGAAPAVAMPASGPVAPQAMPDAPAPPVAPAQTAAAAPASIAGNPAAPVVSQPAAIPQAPAAAPAPVTAQAPAAIPTPPPAPAATGPVAQSAPLPAAMPAPVPAAPTVPASIAAAPTNAAPPAPIAQAAAPAAQKPASAPAANQQVNGTAAQPAPAGQVTAAALPVAATHPAASGAAQTAPQPVAPAATSAAVEAPSAKAMPAAPPAARGPVPAAASTPASPQLQPAQTVTATPQPAVSPSASTLANPTPTTIATPATAPGVAPLPTSPQPPAQGAVARPAAMPISAPPAGRPPTGAVAQAVLAQATQAAAGQDSVAPLLQNLAALQGRMAALPPPVAEAAMRLLNSRINLTRGVPGGETLKQAVLRSGVFLEALSKPGAAQPPAQGDTRAALMALRNALSAWLGPEVSAVSPVTRRPPPPTRGAQPRGLRSEMPTLPESAPAKEAGRALLGQTEAALSRLRLMQLSSLPADAGRAMPGAGAAEWNLELPMLLGHELALMQLQIQRDGRGRGEKRERGWRMAFSLNFSALGEVGAQVSLFGTSASVTIWAEEQETAAALEEMLPELTPALMARGLTVGSVRVRHGRPAPAQAQAGQLMDSVR